MFESDSESVSVALPQSVAVERALREGEELPLRVKTLLEDSLAQRLGAGLAD